MPRKASQLTVRGFDPALDARIREVAEEEGVSLNRAALKLLRRGAGLGQSKGRHRIGTGLDAWIGTWSEKEAAELMASIRACESIEPEFWK